MLTDILKKIQKKQFAPIYLLYGEEIFFINEITQLIIHNALHEDEIELNVSVYDLEETPIELAIEDAETLPFFGERKVILLKNPYFLTAEKSKDKVEHHLEKLIHYLEFPSPFSILIFEAPYDKLDERKKITKLLKQHGEAVESKSLNENEAKAWIKKRFRTYEVEIKDSAMEELLQLTGLHMAAISKEIEKLSLFTGKGGVIDEQSVRLLVPRSVEQNVFDLVEKVVRKQLSEGLKILNDLIHNNEEPIKIVALLAAQFRLINHVKQLSKSGYGQQQMASILKVHPFRVKLAMKQAQLFTDDELKKIMDMLAEADFEMKNGKMDKRLILELLLLKLGDEKTLRS
jgi:DNA polymerase III subunit delta